MKIANYRLQIETNNMDINGMTAVIKDNYSNSVNDMPLNLNGSTVALFSINSDPASYSLDRFSIVFNPSIVLLPLTFRDVKAYRHETEVKIEWSTSNEVNIKGYEVERSGDAVNFVRIKSTPATATNGGVAAYKIPDPHPSFGNNFYRIRSVDINGRASYSKTVQVVIPAPINAPVISIYPNPVATKTISIALKGVPKGSYSLQLTNSAGAVIAARTLQYDAVATIIDFEVNSTFAAGKYELRFSGNGLMIMKTVIKQ